MGCCMSQKKEQISESIKNSKLLEDCTYKNTENFSFKNKTFEAKCVKVYDGDTITVVFMVFGEFYKFNVRMEGYDSPEMKPKTKDTELKNKEKKWAVASRDLLANMIMNKIVLLNCKGFDKYGRVLGTIELNGININNIMIERGYCRPYNGGRKEEWDFTSFEKMSLKNKEK